MTVYNITVLETGESFPCGSEQFVLAAMIHSQKGPVTHGCCGGGCGVCRMKIVQGQYVKAKKMSRAHISVADEENDIVLLCCVQPRDNLIVSKGE